MRTIGHILTAVFLLVPFCIVPIFGQEPTSGGGKKITIIKKSVDADGSEITETIVKKGKAAENFDVDAYVRENSKDNVRVEVRVDDGDVKHQYRYNSNSNSDSNYNEDNDGDDVGAMSCADKSAFLGVEEDADEKATEPGLVVDVVKGSAAAKSGLQSNDVIVKLNDTPVNQWKDLSKFVSQSKPGDKVRIAYTRNGKAANTEATLTTRNEVKQCKEEKRGFLGVNPRSGDDEDEAGVPVGIVAGSAAAKAGLTDGDIILQLDEDEINDWEDISDYMSNTTPGDKISITYTRDGKRQTAETNAGEPKATWTPEPWSDDKLAAAEAAAAVAKIEVREKAACLGVFTGASTLNNQEGTRIDGFTEESAAQEVQMAKGDLITSVNGTPVKNHTDLWNEIAKYQPGEQVNVEYLRENAHTLQVTATLKACRDNSNQVIVNEATGEGDPQTRQFYTWNWGNAEEKSMRERHVITIHRGEGDSPKVNAAPAHNEIPPHDRSLTLQAFRAYPNPTQGQITVEFKGDPVATLVSLFDMSGRQLFREELNAFSGEYNQQFDLSEYAKGTILIQVQQGEQVFTEQIVVN